jgi:predicted nucleic acid-binding protein
VHVVVDASLLASTLIDARGPIGHRYRTQLAELVGSDRAYVLRTLTQLEVLSALKRQLRNAERVGRTDITPEFCDQVVREMSGWPFRRIELTQPMAVRIWELRHNMSPYDAMYVAATEQLHSDLEGNVLLATADARLARTPGLSIPIEVFEPPAD